MLDPNIQRESKPLIWHEPLIPPLLGLVSGILFSHTLGVSWRFSAASALLCFGLWVFCLYRNTRYAHWVAAAAILFWLGSARTNYIRSDPPPRLEADPRELISLEACIVSMPEQERDRVLFWAEVARDTRMRVSWYLRPDQPRPRLHYGERYRLNVRAKPIRNAGNPGSFDAENFMRRRGIYWNATVSGQHGLDPLSGTCGNPAQAWIYQARAALLERIHVIAGPDLYLQAMLGALLLGDNSQLEKAWTENYRKTGTYHAIVVSGLHVSLLAGTLSLVLRSLFLPRTFCLLLCSLLVLLYAMLCDLSAPVVRAAGGFLLYALGQHFFRQARPVNLLCAVALLCLALDPEQLFEGSFLLSFLAVLALGALASPLQQYLNSHWHTALFALENDKLRLSDPRAAELRLELLMASEAVARTFSLNVKLLRRLLRWTLKSILAIVDLLITSAVVLVGLSLPTVLFFHRLNFASLTANLPVVILLNAAVVVGFLAVCIGPVAQPLLAFLLETSRAVVDWHLTWDSGERVPDPPTWLLIALPLFLLATAFLARRNGRAAAASALASLLLFAYLALHPYSEKPLLRPGHLELTSLDIGQGDSLFLASPRGHLSILDGGGVRSDRFDTGESVLSPFLWSRRIGRVDTMIASHGDFDHIGGLLAAFDNFHPREVWVSPYIRGEAWEKLRAKASDRIRVVAAGDELLLGEIPVSVLWPPRNREIAKTNSASLVLLLSYGKHRFLLTGDIEQSVEEELLNNPRLGRLDVLKVAHHGSKTSSSEGFLSHTRPSIAILSAGFANQFGHPHPSVLQRLGQNKSLTLRTDILGQISIYSDGQHLTVDPFRYRDPPSFFRLPILAALE